MVRRRSSGVEKHIELEVKPSFWKRVSKHEDAKLDFFIIVTSANENPENLIRVLIY